MILVRAAAAMLVAGAACTDRAPITSCDDPIAGVWESPAGTRWMVLDHGATLEGFPLVVDGVPDGAPRVIDLARHGKLGGTLHRRFMRRAAVCDAVAPATVTACRDDELQLVLGEVTAPLSYEPCTWPISQPSRVERWHRVR